MATYPSRESVSIDPASTTAMDALPRLNLAGWLRTLGGLAVVGSGIVYMLQGLHSTHAELRYWIYLLLMFALSAGGVFSYRLMQDTKGARLFFALAAVVIPVQFAQLGGMIVDFTALTASRDLSIAAPSPLLLFALATASLLMAALCSRLGFAVLARPLALPLTVCYLSLNLLLLLPFRDLPLGLLPIAFLLLATSAIYVRFFSHRALFATLEGRAVRLMFILPLIIALVRAAFHQDDLAGCSAIAGVAAACLMLFARTCLAHSTLRELVIAVATGFALYSSIGFASATESAGHFNEASSTLLYTLPLLAWLLIAGRVARGLSCVYHCATGLVALPMALSCTTSEPLVTALYMLSGIALCAWGANFKVKAPLMSGALITCAGGSVLLVNAVVTVNGSVWLYLALAGVASVAASSILEKHGSRWIRSANGKFRHMAQWGY